MLKVENIDYWGFEHAIRGMRNPLNSWEKSDSMFCCKDGGYQNSCEDCINFTACHEKANCNAFVYYGFSIGENDMKLMQRLYKAGPEHRKYLRQIMVSLDITAPLYWWKEFDTYKVGTVANSCSTMHTIHKKEFTREDFSGELLQDIHQCTETGCRAHNYSKCLDRTIATLNDARSMYLETKDKFFWMQMIQLLPTSYNQKRTVTMNYENVITIIKQRTGHKLEEWHALIDILLRLPYIEEIMKE